MILYTVVYFQPSAEGYDYTDGFIRSDDEISVKTFESVEEAANFMAKENIKVYDKGYLNKPQYQYISTPEYSFTLLVNGHSTGTFGEGVEWTEKIAEEYDLLQEQISNFNILYSQIYNAGISKLKEEKEYNDLLKKNAQEKAKIDTKFQEYLKLKKEFEN